MPEPHRRTPPLTAASFAGRHAGVLRLLPLRPPAALVFSKLFFLSGNPAIATLASFVPDDEPSRNSLTEQNIRNDLLARDERIRRRWSQTMDVVGFDSSPWRCRG